MVGRLLVGAFVGALLGGAVAAALIYGLKLTVFSGDAAGALLAYGAALGTGVVVGVFAGKPIWASGAKVEAGLKATFGAVFSLAAMFAIRRWAGGLGSLDLGALMLGKGALGDLPAASLPLVGVVLGAFLGADNTQDEPSSKPGRARVAAPKAVGRVEADDDAAADSQSSGAVRRIR